MCTFSLSMFLCVRTTDGGEKPSKRFLRLHAILYKSSQINKYETTEKYLDTVLFQTTVAGDNSNSSGFRLNILDCLLFSIYIELHDSRKLLVVVLHYRETKGFAICRAEGKKMSRNEYLWSANKTY